MSKSSLSLALTLLCASSASADLGPFAKPPEVTRLDNGLTVVTVPWNSPGIVAYYTLVRVGARDEVERGHSGFAHLFEHMMFRGTEHMSEQQYEERLQSFGADNNAYTTQDFTLYTLTAPSSALSEIVAIEADRFQHLAYDERAFRTETGAVLGEYNKSAASPFQKMWEALSELSFKQHTYGHTTIGYLADIQAMPDKYAYSRAFFKRFYTPDNSTIVAAGDVAHGELLELVKKHYGAWQGTRDQPKVPVEPEPSAGASRHIDWDGMTAPELLIGYRTGAFLEEAARAKSLEATAAREVLHKLLFATSSPLYQRLVVEQQKLLELESWSSNFSRDPGLFVVSAELKDATTFEEIELAIQQAIEAVARGELDEERVAAVRSHLRYGLTMGIETASDAADLLAQFIAVSGTTQSMPDYLEALANVTAPDVARAAAELTPGRRFSVTLRAKPRSGESR